MGIINANEIFENISLREVYNATARKVNLYVDGENMRFKGMTKTNRESDNAEERIARGSFAYIESLRQRLIAYLFRANGVCDFKNTFVFMDGKRPGNKITRVIDNTINHSIVRETLIKCCESHPNYTPVVLDYGESELFMYINRDRE